MLSRLTRAWTSTPTTLSIASSTLRPLASHLPTASAAFHTLHNTFTSALSSSITLNTSSSSSRSAAAHTSTFTSTPTSTSITRSFATASADPAPFVNKLLRFKPITPCLRHTVLVDKSQLWKGRPLNSLTVGLRKTGGRSRTTGRITVRHRGGGSKRLYRKIDFKRSILDVRGTVQRLEYDPNRSAFIALVEYPNNQYQYIVAPQGLQPGDSIIASRTREVELTPGNAMLLGQMPIGTVFHCCEMKPGKGAQLARGAGTSCSLIDKNTKPGYALVELQSKEQRYVLLSCMATVGVASNPMHRLRKLGKAGRSRNLGRRPRVRGVAMNPVDHPMGGGGGKKKGLHSTSYSGILAKGYKTRNIRKSRAHIVVPRGGMKKGAAGFAGAAARA